MGPAYLRSLPSPAPVPLGRHTQVLGWKVKGQAFRWSQLGALTRWVQGHVPWSRLWAWCCAWGRGSGPCYPPPVGGRTEMAWRRGVGVGRRVSLRKSGSEASGGARCLDRRLRRAHLSGRPWFKQG